ncbi:MAG: hypothetical protein M1482_01370 [Chloroflexi bacterium]|nr:hypothetical protein [Chloroflexota bacterium]
MPENLGFPLFIVAVLIFMGWFAVGTQWNVRKGDAVLKWLRQGLPVVGERTTMRWLGSSVVELKIAKAKDPFRSVETLVVFEPRDVVFLWALARLQRRRDLVIFRAQLRTAPAFEMEAFDPHAWTSNHIERDVRKKGWTQVDLSATGQPLLAFQSDASIGALKPLVELASQAGGRLVRLSVRRSLPNLEVQWLLPDVSSRQARDMFSSLQHLGAQTMSA